MNNNNNNCYVVTHQRYVYACGCGFCDGDSGEYKDILEYNFDVLGVFSTKKLAKKYIKKHSEDRCDGDKPYAKAQREWHYGILPMQIDDDDDDDDTQ